MKPRTRIGEQVAYSPKIVDNNLPTDPKAKKPKRQPESTTTRQRVRG